MMVLFWPILLVGALLVELLLAGFLYQRWSVLYRRNRRRPASPRPPAPGVSPIPSDDAPIPTESTTYQLPWLAIARTCYPTRNGTPRQPCLVPTSRALLLPAAEPDDAWSEVLTSVAGSSHVWLTFVFHTNTNAHKSTFRPKIRPPRLGTKMVGAFATRTPHRPNPLGISLCRLEGIQGRQLCLSGIDLVDGTPILAVQPYHALLNHADSVQDYHLPDWLTEPIERQEVLWSDAAAAALDAMWVAGPPRHSLYDSAAALRQFITDNLQFDIRSVRHKHKGLDRSAELRYRVYLDTVDVVWTVVAPRQVLIEELILLEQPGHSPLNPATNERLSTS